MTERCPRQLSGLSEKQCPDSSQLESALAVPVTDSAQLESALAVPVTDSAQLDSICCPLNLAQHFHRLQYGA